MREALLQIVLTVSTLGGEVQPIFSNKNATAEWFNIFFILAILLVVLWGVSLIIEAMVQGEFVYYWGARRMERRIAQLTNHYLICGFGRMGQEIARQLARARKSFVIVEHNPNQFVNMEASGYPFIQGDAREDDVLLTAGIERAKGLIAVAATDEENVYISLSARVLNPNLYIVTRSSHASGEAKLLRAGADRVFSPYIIGGRRMAQAILSPSVVEFLDTIVHGEEMELVLEEVEIKEDSPIHNQVIGGDHDVESIGVHLLGIATANGRMLMRGLDKHRVRMGDVLILLGEPSAMQVAVKQLTGRDVDFGQQTSGKE
ncbi:MAG: potassium channel family protein [Armatimonadota bacterium]